MHICVDGGAGISYTISENNFLACDLYRQKEDTMKKIWIALLCMLITVSALALSASADTLTLFVKDGGRGNGESPERALGVLEDAFAILGEEGGTVVVCGKTTMHTALTDLAPWTGLVTLTMVHGGTDYRESGAELYYTGQHRFFFAGPTKIENFTFHIAQTALIAAQWHPLEMGEGITVKQHTSGQGIYLLGGSQNAAEGDYAFRDRSPSLVIRSGKYHAVSPYARQVQGTFTASAETYIYGGEINYLMGGPLNFGILTANSVLNVYGGKIANLCLFTDPGNTTDRLQGEGNYVANIHGGEITKLICDANNQTAKFYVNYDSGAQANIATLAEGEGVANLTVFDLTKPAVTEVKLTIGSMTGYVNGEARTLDAAPVIRNARTMLPVRFVAENLGATVGWDGATSTVTVKTEATAIEIVIGKATAKVGGIEVALDSPAFIENSRTYLPVRFVAENLGATVAWDGATSTATLTAERTTVGAPTAGTVAPPAAGG